MTFQGIKLFLCTGLLVLSLFPRGIQADYQREHRTHNNFLSLPSSDFEGANKRSSARNLQQFFVGDCFQPTCQYSNSLDSGSFGYGINIGASATLMFEFATGMDSKDLTLSVEAGPTTLTQTIIALNPPEVGTDGTIAIITGTSWIRALALESTNVSNRVLSVQIQATSTVTPSSVTFRIMQPSSPARNNVVWSSSDGSSVWEVIVALVGGTIVLAFLIFCIHSLCTRRRYSRPRIGQAGRQAPDLEIVALPDPEEEARKLSEENLDERFPEAPFDTFKSFFQQRMCSICLEELKADQICRQLYCEHVFHSECIKLWLVNQLKKKIAFCPNCNMNMMFEHEHEHHQAQGPTQINSAQINSAQIDSAARNNDVVNNSV